MKKKAFTLLEIIIVIIIVGVLASLALPRFFRMIESCRSVEAMAMLTQWHHSIERCFAQTLDYTLCTTFDDLDIEDPTTAPGSHFDSYGMWGNQANYFIQVGRNTVNLAIPDTGGQSISCPGVTGLFDNTPSRVGLCVNNTANKIHIRGTGFYKGL